LILGEVQTSISRREISRFQKLVKKAAQLENITSNDVCQVIVVHDVTPTIEEYAKEQGIHLYWSYYLQKSLPIINHIPSRYRIVRYHFWHGNCYITYFIIKDPQCRKTVNYIASAWRLCYFVLRRAAKKAYSKKL